MNGNKFGCESDILSDYSASGIKVRHIINITIDESFSKLRL